MPESDSDVRIAGIKAARAPETLSAIGLGSCVALILWEPQMRVGALAHIMLPSSLAFPPSPLPGKFADTALPALLQQLKDLGARQGNLVGKLVGGANMFSAQMAPNQLSLGLRNVMAAREALRLSGIPLKAEEVGGTKGRTIKFRPEDGRVLVRKMYETDVWL